MNLVQKVNIFTSRFSTDGRDVKQLPLPEFSKFHFIRKILKFHKIKLWVSLKV